MSADDFNEAEWESGRLKPAHISELAARFQRAEGLEPDGKVGPSTRARLELLRGRIPGEPPPIPSYAPLEARDGWLVGERVTVVPSHRSWYYDRLDTPSGIPGAIVAHYTATDPGTAIVMANKRVKPYRRILDRAASWHVSVEADGSIVQMAPFIAGCWHAGGRSAKPIAGLGPANRTAVGVELVGHGENWPAAQVAAAARVWRALVRAYTIPRARAMVTHQELDPTRKRDPGELWLTHAAPGVLDYAYRSD